jgi:hypothetical protein
MSWATEHAPQILGCFFFFFIVYLLVEELMNRKNSND